MKRVEGLKGLVSLKALELNNNLVYRLEDINVLRKHVPQLEELNMRNNAMCEAKSYRSLVRGLLPTLTLTLTDPSHVDSLTLIEP